MSLDSSGKPMGEDGFIELWPTRFLKRHMPSSDAANPVLIDLVLAEEKKHTTASVSNAGNSVSEKSAAQKKKGDLTTDYLNQDLLQIDNPVIGWLTQCINKTVADYLKAQGHNYPIDWGLQAWANINRRGDYHNLHNHPHSYLSGTYYVSVPDSSLENSSAVDAGSRQDLNPGAISFYDPRPQANMTAIRSDAQIDPEFRIQPSPGLLLLWPSFLHHFVHPNLSDQLRISISFNVVLKWKDDYIPR